MAQRGPEAIWSVLEQQSREDEAAEAQVHAIAAMSDAELDAELRSCGLDPAALEAQALTLSKVAGAGDDAVQAVDAHEPPALSRPARRRRPVAVAVWLAAGAAAVTAGGALIYSMVREHPPDQPAPPPSSPVPAPSPAPELVAMTPAQERTAAADALSHGNAAECLRLLDDARVNDPEGDKPAAIQKLRADAMRVLRGDKLP
jgi:hypothetical protein